MNRDDILRMAEEAELTSAGECTSPNKHVQEVVKTIQDQCVKFAYLVAAAERKSQIAHAEGCWSWGPTHYECACKELAKAKGWAK